jgi:hypothetical protein
MKSISLNLYDFLGVLTKADKFNGKKDPAVKQREAKFRKHLGIPLNRFARIKNYCEDIDEDLKYRFSVIPFDRVVCHVVAIIH